LSRILDIEKFRRGGREARVTVDVCRGGTPDRVAVEPHVEELEGFPDPFAVFELFREEPYPFFLDSGMDPEKLGRYSFLGCRPFLLFRSKGSDLQVIRGGRSEWLTGDPFRVLSDLVERYCLSSDLDETLPPFLGGAVGYFGYDLGLFVEELPCTTRDDLPMPDCFFAFYDTVVAFDHMLRRVHLCSCDVPGEEPSGLSEWIRAEFGRRVFPGHRSSTVGPFARSEIPSGRLRANFSRAAYLDAVRRAKEYIAAGDIYQVNLSQRFVASLPVSPFDLYARLRVRNPAPFAAYLDFGDGQILSSSPERFLHFSARTRMVRTRPIKGTRPRGVTPEEDQALACELLSSEKDRAELVMIVDLERNDLGRVCEIGSVHVPELVVLEQYATVFHLVSTVAGRLPPDRYRIDLVRATFPGGSITGAPKIRAMEIIDELEPTRRGVYTGAIGYLSFTGDMDLNIVIRTMAMREGTVWFQVGGGVVADSEPSAEYQETLDKARALMEVLV